MAAIGNRIFVGPHASILIPFDSLQATWIRNILLRALQDSAEFDIRQTTDNFVYKYPSIAQLSKFLASVAQGKRVAVSGSPVDAIRAMVNKYSKDFVVTPEDNSDTGTRKIVLITGTTGAPGSHILASLVLDENVQHIYAVNRPGDASVNERQRRAFSRHGLDVGLEKVIMLEADLSAKSQALTEVLTLALGGLNDHLPFLLRSGHRLCNAHHSQW